jgi:ribosome recycling factor
MKLIDELEDNMQKSVDKTQQDLNTIRTGRANASLLDKIMVEYYGTPTPLRTLANITTPDSTTILIQPFDKGSTAQVEKAISMSDLGLTPNNDGQVIRLNIPPLTSDRRQEFVKLAGKYAEEGKVAIRNIRRDGMDKIKKQQKNGHVSEDESHDIQDNIQNLTDKYVAKIDQILEAKEKELTSI